MLKSPKLFKEVFFPQLLEKKKQNQGENNENQEEGENKEAYDECQLEVKEKDKLKLIYEVKDSFLKENEEKKISLEEMIEIKKFMLEKTYKYKYTTDSKENWQFVFMEFATSFFEFLDYETTKFYKQIIKIHIFYMEKFLGQYSNSLMTDSELQNLKDLLFFKNIILIILKVYKFMVDIDIELKQHGTSDFSLAFSAKEEAFARIGKYTKYFLQVKPYAKKYKIYADLYRQEEGEAETNNRIQNKYSIMNKNINSNSKEEIEMRNEDPNNNENNEEAENDEEESFKNNENNCNECKMQDDREFLAYDSAMNFRDQYIKSKEIDFNDHLRFPPFETCNPTFYMKYKNYDKEDNFIDTNKTNDLICEFEEHHGKKSTKTEVLGKLGMALRNKKTLLPQNCDEHSIFRSIDKIRLLVRSFDQFFRLGKLFSKGFVKSDFHMRNEEACHYKDKTGSLLCDSLNILSEENSVKHVNHIRNYLGEEVSFYILWIQKLIYFLILPAFLGLIAEVLVKYFNSTDPKKTEYIFPFFILQIRPIDIIRGLLCIIPPVSIALFLKYWDDKEKLYSYFWGVEKSKEAEPYQERYKFEKQIEFIFNLKLKVQSKFMYYFRCSVSTLISLILVGMVVFVNIFVISLKKNIVDKTNYFWMYFPSALNAIGIKVLSFTYRYLAYYLSFWENHEKNSTRIANLSLKIFLFEFVNNFFVYYYTAFYKFYQKEKNGEQGCIDNDCMSEIEVQSYMSLAIIFSINFIEVGLPIFYNYRTLSALKEQKILEKKEELMIEGKIICNHHIELSKEEISKLEASPEMNEGKTVIETLIEDYLEIIIYIAYVLLLSSSAPLVPLFVIMLLIFEKGVDTFKLYQLCRLKELKNFSTITIYNYMILIVIFVGSFTNIGMYVFSREFAYIDDKYNTTNNYQLSLLIKIFLFMILQNFIFVCNGVLDYKFLPTCKLNKIFFNLISKYIKIFKII